MFFNLSKLFITLAAIAAIQASPSIPPNAVTCDFVLNPEAPVDANANLQAEFNYAIGFTLIHQIPSHETFSGNATWIDNGTTFAVKQTIAAVGESKAHTAEIMNGWVGTTLESIVTNWLVESAQCA